MPDDPLVGSEPDDSETAKVRVRPRGLKQAAAGAAGAAAAVLGYVLVGGDSAETASPDLPVPDQTTSSSAPSQTTSSAPAATGPSVPAQPTPALAKPKKIWWHNLKSTMCIRAPAAKDTINVTVVDCRAEHEAEVVGRGVLKGSKNWPGDDVLDTLAMEKCTGAFKPYVGLSFDESALEVDYFTADPEGWKAGDRTVVCLVFDPEEPTTTRVLRGVQE